MRVHCLVDRSADGRIHQGAQRVESREQAKKKGVVL